MARDFYEDNKSIDQVIFTAKISIGLIIVSIILSILINVFFFLFPNTDFPVWTTTPFLQRSRPLIIANAGAHFYEVVSAVYAKNIVILLIGLFYYIYSFFCYEIRFINRKRVFYSILSVLIYLFAFYVIFIGGPDVDGPGITQTRLYLGDYFSGVFMITVTTPFLTVFLSAALSLCFYMRKKRKGIQ